MVRERVRVGAEPTWVYTVPSRHGGLLLTNTGSVDVVVDTREDVIADDPTAGLAVGVGQTVTIPRADPNYSLGVWAVTTAGGNGEVTYLLPG
jgi:hypothetical protein